MKPLPKILQGLTVAGSGPVIIQTEAGHAFAEKVRAILFHDWDPIGVSAVAEASDEYDAYVGPVLQILCGSRSAEDIVEFLHWAETKNMGLWGSKKKHRMTVAEKLLSLEVRT